MKNPIWENTPYTLSKNNVPLIKNCVANIDCKIIELIAQGDHVIFICRINEVNIDQKKKPLIYLGSKYI